MLASESVVARERNNEGFLAIAVLAILATAFLAFMAILAIAFLAIHAILAIAFYR